MRSATSPPETLACTSLYPTAIAVADDGTPPGKRYEDWELDDPAGLDVGAVRSVRDEIRVRVEVLLREIGVQVG